MPIPWEGDTPAYGFNATGQLAAPASKFLLPRYEANKKVLLAPPSSSTRLSCGFALSWAWEPDWNGLRVTGDRGCFSQRDRGVIANIGGSEITLPAGEVLVSSGELSEHLAPNTAVGEASALEGVCLSSQANGST